jgi:S-disulfanyl-L-cysteine oxidoreductase SoxD
MCSCRELMLAAILSCAVAAQAQPAPYPGIGRAATAKEVAAWDIDVRPDFKGLPKGSGSVAQGMVVWEGKCASCHGVFGESNEFFNPLVGGTTRDDIATGHVARLNDRSFPSRTTLMKLSTVSTLWDYIRRAMPWTAPKSLGVDEVYGVTAYILNLGGIVPDDFVLSDRNIAEVQGRLPNRDGMTTAHALWPGREFGVRKPDVQAVACMKNCATEARVASFLPEFARNAHGNLAEQNRTVGAQHGADTSRPAATSLARADEPGRALSTTLAPTASPASAEDSAATAMALTRKFACVACHGLTDKLVGPAFRDVAGKYAGRADAVEYLAGKIRAGGSGVWGAMAMPPQSLGPADANTIAQWLASGAKK